MADYPGPSSASAAASPAPSPAAPHKVRPWLAHPEDVHCVVFDVVLKLSYLAAFAIWLKWDDVATLAATGGWGKTAFTLAAALMLGWCSGINVGVNFHNHTHVKVFTRPWLSRWFGRLWTLSGGWPASFWQHSHVTIHHAHLLDPEIDWTLMRRGKDGRFENIYRYSLLHWPFRYAVGLWRDFRGGRWGPIGGEATKELLIFLALYSIPFWIDWRMGLALWLFPSWLANAMVMGPGMYAQHADCERKSPAKPYGHSNTFTSKFFNLSMFNIGFHVEHHDHPMVHWSELPRLHEKMKSDLAEGGAHVVPYGYYRAGQLLCRATFSKGAGEAWRAQHPDFVPTRPAAEKPARPAVEPAPKAPAAL
jgi:fatty acid desaturase